MEKRGSRQPPPAPRKKRYRKCIRPSARVKRKLNFDDASIESVDEKKFRLPTQHCKRCAVSEEKAPARRRRDDIDSSERESTTEIRPKSEEECENEEESEVEKVKS